MLGETIVQGICVIEMWRNERTHKTFSSLKIQKLSYPTDATNLVESFFENTANLGFKRKMRVDYHPRFLTHGEGMMTSAPMASESVAGGCLVPSAETMRASNLPTLFCNLFCCIQDPAPGTQSAIR
jgi:hypothetical protein